jgi:hypothetical protein
MRLLLAKTPKLYSLNRYIAFHKHVIFPNLHVASVTNRNLGHNQ